MPVFKNSQGLLRVVAAYPNITDHINGVKSKPKLKRDLLHSVPIFDSLQMEKRTKFVTEYWDEGCACLLTVTSTIVHTDKTIKTRHHTTTIDSKPTHHASNNALIQHRGNTRSYGTTTYTTTTATGYITPKPHTNTRPNPPDPTGVSAINVDAGAFAGLFLGVTGGCLQRRSGVLVCTSTSLWVPFPLLHSSSALTALKLSDVLASFQLTEFPWAVRSIRSSR